MAGQAALLVLQKCRTADSTYAISTEQIRGLVQSGLSVFALQRQQLVMLKHKVF